jgi:hypothetical protein
MNKFVDFLCYTGVATILIGGGYSVYQFVIKIMQALMSFYN